MTDRPALAEAIVQALVVDRWITESQSDREAPLLAMDQLGKPRPRAVVLLIARVLAEHETPQAKGAIETMRAGEDLVVIERKEYDTLTAAEARCAQLERERDEWKAAAGVHIHAQQEIAKLLTESRTKTYQAEARCAQLEQELRHTHGDLDYCRGEQASIDAILEDRDGGTTYLKVEALLAEHERLRESVQSWVKDFEQWTKNESQGYDTLAELVWSLLEESAILLQEPVK